MSGRDDAADGRQPRRPRLLFVCSRNAWRSPTGEDLYRRDDRVEVASAGTAASARRRVDAELIAWADVIFAMETRHRDRLSERFGARAETKTRVLDIPDDYRRGDPELTAWLRDEVEAWLADQR